MKIRTLTLRGLKGVATTSTEGATLNECVDKMIRHPAMWSCLDIVGIDHIETKGQNVHVIFSYSTVANAKYGVVAGRMESIECKFRIEK